MQDFFINVLSIGSLFISILIISFILSLILKSHGMYANFLKKNGMLVIAFISFVATVGSLIMSVVWEFPPCDLCWYQRMFMYPIALISLLSLYRKDYKNGAYYSVVLSSLGFIIAVYHYSIQMLGSFKNNSYFCSVDSIDCSIPDFIKFGFVTTPFISLSAFTLIIIASIYAKNRI